MIAEGKRYLPCPLRLKTLKSQLKQELTKHPSGPTTAKTPTMSPATKKNLFICSSFQLFRFFTDLKIACGGVFGQSKKTAAGDWASGCK